MRRFDDLMNHAEQMVGREITIYTTSRLWNAGWDKKIYGRLKKRSSVMVLEPFNSNKNNIIPFPVREFILIMDDILGWDFLY